MPKYGIKLKATANFYFYRKPTKNEVLDFFANHPALLINIKIERIEETNEV